MIDRHHAIRPAGLDLTVDRSTRTPLTEQIRAGVSGAISAGVLVPGARLPSWRDLAAQLGVARGTVRAAYERLSDAQLIVSSTRGGTRVADRPSSAREVTSANTLGDTQGDMPEIYREVSSGTGIFQMGVPASECFPAKLFSRIRGRAVRMGAAASCARPDPRGEHELRREIAAHLAIARSIECLPSQVLITTGFTGALGLALQVLQLQGRNAWVEDPGFPLTRRALQLAGLSTAPVPVDAEGIDVAHGMLHAGDASLAVVTPGQQAPLGMPLSLDRRLRLLQWAEQAEAWIVEDDYLGELQLDGRAAPALASLDRAGRVIHVGSFSKTISPTLRLGFVVVPPSLVRRFTEVAACLAPAPDSAVQVATAEFMRDGHYMRHLRRTKRVLGARREALMERLKQLGVAALPAGLATLLPLPEGARDTLIAGEASGFGIAPAPLSPWYCGAERGAGLLLGVATAPKDHLAASCERLHQLIARFA